MYALLCLSTQYVSTAEKALGLLLGSPKLQGHVQTDSALYSLMNHDTKPIHVSPLYSSTQTGGADVVTKDMLTGEESRVTIG